jgi:hypothetical protein
MLNSDPPNMEGARETVWRILRDGNRAVDEITRLRTLYSKKESASRVNPLIRNFHRLNVLARTKPRYEKTFRKRNCLYCGVSGETQTNRFVDFSQ